MPLEDADIFKAQIYQKLSKKEEQREFIKQWDYLTKTCTHGKISGGINEVFRYYSHVLRGRENGKEKEVGLRNFFAGKNDKYERLHKSDLLPEVTLLANFWKQVNTNKQNKDIPEFTPEVKQYLDVLSKYLNECWKYPVCSFFLMHKDLPKVKFNSKFLFLLKQLSAYLLVMQLTKPGLSNIRQEIYKAQVAISKGDEWTPSITSPTENEIRSSFGKVGKGIKAFLLLHAYLHPAQKCVIADSTHIEHILPRSWQKPNYNGWNSEDAKSKIETLGNLVVFEKKLNIKASDGYFGKKRKFYKESKISVVKDLLKHRSGDWGKDDIEKRDKEVKNTLFDFFKKQLSKKG
ncbi:hypothetical protein FACS189454_09380 [Planctomycetales bacterium]|nr:hypothetical protein FACS189454_09380 [Planctomycetales bacterium]